MIKITTFFRLPFIAAQEGMFPKWVGLIQTSTGSPIVGLLYIVSKHNPIIHFHFQFLERWKVATTQLSHHGGVKPWGVSHLEIGVNKSASNE